MRKLRCSRSRFDESDDEISGLENVLNHDFKLMVSVTPKPEEAFCPKSSDYQLASHWYKKLINWNCRTLEQMRLRHRYMSHLSVCLHKKRLTGIFKEVPSIELTWVDFTQMNNTFGACCTATMTSSVAWQNMALMMLPQQLARSPGSCCEQPAKSEQSDSRSAGGSNMRKLSNKPAHKVTCKLKPKLVPRHLAGSEDLQKSQHDSADSQAASSGQQHHWPIDEQARTDMKYLLEVINKELRGQQNKETDEYLELEMRRYRDFYARHRHNDPDLKANVAAGPQKERIFMLINMKNDLVKLLSE